MVAHAIQLTNGGLGSNLSNRFQPSLLSLDDQDFVNRFLSELDREDGLSRLQEKLAAVRNDQNELRLYQPVHQIFHMALIDVSCREAKAP